MFERLLRFDLYKKTLKGLLIHPSQLNEDAKRDSREKKYKFLKKSCWWLTRVERDYSRKEN